MFFFSEDISRTSPLSSLLQVFDRFSILDQDVSFTASFLRHFFRGKIFEFCLIPSALINRYHQLCSLLINYINTFSNLESFFHSVVMMHFPLHCQIVFANNLIFPLYIHIQLVLQFYFCYFCHDFCIKIRLTPKINMQAFLF